MPLSILDDQQEEEEKVHPFDAIFGKKMYKHMNKKGVVERMNWTEFKSIEWDHLFPYFIIDLVQYISAFQMIECMQQKKQKEVEEQKAQVYREMIQKKKEEGEILDEQFLMEQYKRQNMSDADTDLLILKQNSSFDLYY